MSTVEHQGGREGLGVGARARRLGCGVACALVSGLVMLGGCSLILREDAEQCSNDDDCKSLGPNFVGSTCNIDGRCVLGGDVGSGGSGGGSGGSGGVSGSGGGGGIAPAACKKNSDCFGSTGPSLCREQRCVPLISPDDGCVDAKGTPTDDDAVNTIVGFLTPRSGGTEGFLGDNLSKAFELAREGYGDARPQSAPLAPVTVYCDEITDPARAVRYLTDTLGARLIVGPTFDQSLGAVVAETRPKGVLLVSPTADGLGMNKAPLSIGDDLLWSCRPNRALVAGYYQEAFDAAVEAFTAKGHDLTTVRPVRISPTNGSASEPSAAEFIAEFESTFRINNGPALSSPNYRRIDYPWSVSTTTNFSTIGTQVAAMAQEANPPNIVLLPTSIDDSAAIIEEIEKKWPQTVTRPVYFMDEPSERFALLVGNQPSVRPRVLGLRPYRDAKSRPAYNAFFSAYQDRFGGIPLPRAEYVFDCFHLVWYSLLSAGEIEAGRILIDVSAAELREGVATMNAGDDIVVGKAEVSIFANKISSGAAGVNLIGASGPLTFGTGAISPVADGELYCISDLNGPCRTGTIINAATGAVTTESSDCTCGD
jgi:hypothetical protein